MPVRALPEALRAGLATRAFRHRSGPHARTQAAGRSKPKPGPRLRLRDCGAMPRDHVKRRRRHLQRDRQPPKTDDFETTADPAGAHGLGTERAAVCACPVGPYRSGLAPLRQAPGMAIPGTATQRRPNCRSGHSAEPHCIWSPASARLGIAVPSPAIFSRKGIPKCATVALATAAFSFPNSALAP